MKRKWITLTLWLLLFAGGFSGWFIGNSFAEETDISALQSRVRQLEERIKELESLLGDAQAAKIPVDGDQSKWQNKKNWRKLSVGMRDSDVEQILGKPIKVIHGVKTLWFYPNIYRGHVTFDEKGQLIGWIEP